MALLLLLITTALQAETTPSRLLRARPEFSGVARLRVMGTCTAFLIRPRPSLDAPVYVLTNGHCVLGGSVQNQVETNIPARNGTVTFDYFFDTSERQAPVAIKSIPYGTLKGLDVAIVELDATWERMERMRVQPVTLAEAPLRRGDEVYTIGAPVNGIPAGEQWLRRSDCAVDAIAQLAEGPWKFNDAMRLRCAAVFGGASGSPVFDKRTNRVAAILNTSTQGNQFTSGDVVCFTNSPCELRENGATVELDAGYALPLDGIDGCFDTGGRFNLRLASCPLDPGIEFTLRGTPQVSVRPGSAWNVSLNSALYTHYRYKTGVETVTDCRDERGYSSAVEAATPIREPLPEAEARYLLCVIGGVEGRWQQARFATYVHTVVDNTPPAVAPLWDVFDDENGYSVRMNFLVPDLSDYRYKFGGASTTDCDSSDGYQIYRRVPIRVPAQAELVRFCILGGDRNANFTRPTALLLGPQQPLPSGLVRGAGFRKGPQSPGSWASVFLASGFREPRTMFTIRDAAGVEHNVEGLNFGQQSNLLLPPTLALGPAELRVPSTPPSSIRFDVERLAPGIFSNFELTPRRLSDGMQFTVGGISAYTKPEATVIVAGQRLTGRVGRGVFGNVVFLDFPETFPFRGYLPVQIETDGVRSNTVYIWLRDEGI